VGSEGDFHLFDLLVGLVVGVGEELLKLADHFSTGDGSAGGNEGKPEVGAGEKLDRGGRVRGGAEEALVVFGVMAGVVVGADEVSRPDGASRAVESGDPQVGVPPLLAQVVLVVVLVVVSKNHEPGVVLLEGVVVGLGEVRCNGFGLWVQEVGLEVRGVRGSDAQVTDFVGNEGQSVLEHV